MMDRLLGFDRAFDTLAAVGYNGTINAGLLRRHVT
jgi:hypothetical protein